MNRRSLLSSACKLTAACSAAVVAVPGVTFLLAPLLRKNKKGEETDATVLIQRICLLEDLALNEPHEEVLKGNRTDAWTMYANETLGRVWLVLRSKENTPPAKTQVDAYSAICPHLGCLIEGKSEEAPFYCPCHKAAFTNTGEAIREEGKDNPSPRGMDTLPCKIVQDEKTQKWWVEVEYQDFVLGSKEKLRA